MFKFNTYKISIFCFILSLSCTGFGEYIFGYKLFTNVSSIFICILFFIFLCFNKLVIPKFLFNTYFFIFFISFVLNINYIDIQNSVINFLGFVLISLTIYNFVSFYFSNIQTTIKYYFNFCFLISIIGILQFLLFIFLKFSFVPHYYISGRLNSNYSFKNEVYEIFPRIIGLSTEPAHYSILLLPSVFIALFNLFGFNNIFKFKNKYKSISILIGFILSFSIVGFLGLLFGMVYLFFSKLKSKINYKIYLILFSFLFSFFFYNSNLSSKFKNLSYVNNNFTLYNFTTSDLSGFAIFSNILIAKKSLYDSYFLGRGINSHQISYNKFIYKIFNKKQVLLELNKNDAGSMFIRIISEFGILGFLLFLYFLYKFKIKHNHYESKNYFINLLAFLTIISFCFRNGNYLDIFFLFFISIFFYSYSITYSLDDKKFT